MEEFTFNESDFDNYTEYEYDVIEPCSYSNSHSLEKVMGPYIFSIICILGFLGNSLVIITYACYKRTKSTTDIFLFNVAIADLVFVVALPLIVYNELSSWSMGLVACKMLRGSYSVNLYSGMLLLACISTDHYIAIVQARRSFRLHLLSYTRIICTIVWVCAFLLSVPTFYFYHWYEPSHTKDIIMIEEDSISLSPHYVCEFRFSDNNTAWRTKVTVPNTQMAVGFFLPLLITIFCCTAVIITLLKAKNFQRHKAVRVVLAVVAVFIICHLPYNITLLYDTVKMFDLHTCEALDALQMAKTMTQTIAYLHCCLNPVLYIFIGVKFRNHFRRIVQDLCCLRCISRVSSEIKPSNRRVGDRVSDNSSSFIL